MTAETKLPYVYIDPSEAVVLFKLQLSFLDRFLETNLSKLTDIDREQTEKYEKAYEEYKKLPTETHSYTRFDFRKYAPEYLVSRLRGAIHYAEINITKLMMVKSLYAITASEHNYLTSIKVGVYPAWWNHKLGTVDEDDIELIRKYGSLMNA